MYYNTFRILVVTFIYYLIDIDSVNLLPGRLCRRTSLTAGRAGGAVGAGCAETGVADVATGLDLGFRIEGLGFRV